MTERFLMWRYSIRTKSQESQWRGTKQGYVTVQLAVHRLIVLVPADNKDEETNPARMLASEQLSERKKPHTRKDASYFEPARV